MGPNDESPQVLSNVPSAISAVGSAGAYAPSGQGTVRPIAPDSKIPAMALELNMLDDQIARTEDLLSTLATRLSPVSIMNPEPSKAQETDAQPLAELSQRVRVARNRLMNLAKAIVVIRDSLQV